MRGYFKNMIGGATCLWFDFFYVNRLWGRGFLLVKFLLNGYLKVEKVVFRHLFFVIVLL